MTDADTPRPITFIVRLSLGEAGRITGIVQRVSTGEKERFHSVEALSPLVARMALGGQERADGPAEGGPQ